MSLSALASLGALPPLPDGAHLALSAPGWGRGVGTGGRVWPASEVLCHVLQTELSADASVLELGCGVGAAALALARCNASVVATDISEAALALTAENTNGTNGTVVTRLLDWDDDAALREVLAEVARVKSVPPEEARALGFDEGMLENDRNNPGNVLVPAWRNAQISIRHPLFERGLPFGKQHARARCRFAFTRPADAGGHDEGQRDNATHLQQAGQPCIHRIMPQRCAARVAAMA